LRASSGSFATFAAIRRASSLVSAWRRIVDPSPKPKKAEEGRPHTTFTIATSDAFFERPENRVRAQGSQLALINGDHSRAKALHDFENLEALAAPNSIIAIHDVVPDDMDAKTATSKAETAFHIGDVGAGWTSLNLGHDKRARFRDLRNFKAQRDDVLDSDFLRFCGNGRAFEGYRSPF